MEWSGVNGDNGGGGKIYRLAVMERDRILWRDKW